MDIIKTETEKLIFSWCPQIEESALNQMKALAEFPFVKYCALMPDAHFGMGIPIGGVIGCEGVIIPQAVGVDIGCGVITIKSNLKKSDILDVELRKKIHASICRGIPMGFAHNPQERVKFLKIHYGTKVNYIFQKADVLSCSHTPVEKIEEAVYSQLGTLGGGNHFCELDYDEDDNIWITIHSGSRNIGKRVCDYFNKIAEELNKIWFSIDTKKIPFLPTSTDEGKAYLLWMDFALKFAFLNRQVMIDEAIKDITHILPNAEFDSGSLTNIHHNYASLENHFGKNLWVHRKGAVLAKEGTKGIIPGSMGTASYIVEGLGNPKSLNSSSHGAGRNKGRNVFNTEMNNEDGIKKVKDAMEGVVYSNFGRSVSRKGKDNGMLDVSEAPQAYKNIDSVMENQKDLVKPLHKLMPLINWKDTGEE